MIIKKVANPDKSATKRTRITRLLEYIRTPERADATEKCVHYGTRRFLTNDSADQTAEMVGLAQAASLAAPLSRAAVLSCPSALSFASPTRATIS